MVVAQQPPVTPIHVFVIGQSCTRQADNNRNKQNDVLRYTITVLGVTDIQGCWLILPHSSVPE
jgi:hypothetical protein